MRLQSEPAILIVPDSFKGTLAADEVADAIAAGFRKVFPKATISCCPMADGGEGSSVIIGEQLNATRVEQLVSGPHGEYVNGFFYYLRESRTAYVELAAASGYSFVKDKPKAADRATTAGTGELIRAAIELGATDIVLFLGGSATTDGGVGMAKALGFQFLDQTGKQLPSATEWPCSEIFPGEQLDLIAQIDRGESAQILSRVKISAIVDVANPLCGPNGAAAIYGPQKGATPEQVTKLDQALSNLAEIVKRDLGSDYTEREGAGAAGGAGFGVLSFFGGELTPGAPFFLEAINFDSRLSTADLVITGEGKIDRQSIQGKLCKELLHRTKSANKPLLSICGRVDLQPEDYECYPNLIAFGLDHPEAMTKTREVLENRSTEIAAELLEAPIKS